MPLLRSAIACVVLLASSLTAGAQYPNSAGKHFPVHQRMPPGVAAYWTAMQGKANHGYFQPIRIELPRGGHVTVYGAGATPVVMAAPAQFRVGVGYVYRVRISDMPEFPGAELYPSIEVLDRLHPPPGLAEAFPIPVQFTADEIEQALEGRMVTKAVYLEQPQLAPGRPFPEAGPLLTAPPDRNLLVEADRVGRPMLLVRLGGRTPRVGGMDPAFFGSGAPVVLSSRPAADRSSQ